MLTKCPEKKESGATALAVDKLLAVQEPARRRAAQGHRLRHRRVAQAGGHDARASRSRPRTAPRSCPCSFDGGTPAGFDDGASVVLGGNIDADGVFDATSVALTGQVDAARGIRQKKETG